MADFVTTQVKASKEVIDAMINIVPGHPLEGKVDFECIVPVPDELKPIQVQFGGWKASEDTVLRKWSDENWGTSGNAMNTLRKSDTSVYFETAWADPMEVLRALSRKFPTERILIRQAGDTNYYWSGSYILLNGQVKQNSNRPNVKDIDSINRFASKVRNRKYA